MGLRNNNSKMNTKDYKKIMEYYKLNTSKMNNKTIKNKAEDILAKKLCKCIKKVKGKSENKDERRAIGICKNSVITKKNIKIFTFNCKKKNKLNPKKGTRKLKIEKL